MNKMINNKESMRTSEKMKGALLLSIMALCFVFCTSCNRDDIYKEEQYKNLVYLLSGSENVYAEAYTLNEIEPVKYFSIGCGGSKPNSKEIVVTLVPDIDLFNQYNIRNFDLESSYAKLLPASKYEIGTYVVSIPANPADQYVKTSVKVRPLGLSPDTIYFIPLMIKSVSHYEVNEDKYNMLYRVTIENDYARQKVTTQYTKRGTVKNQNTNAETLLVGTKVLHPLTKDKVRMLVANESLNQTVADIERRSITVQINTDNTLDITPYGTMEVEMLDEEGYNLYDPKVLQPFGTKTQRVFYLYYRYRLQNSDGTFGVWQEVKESLTRVEED